MINIIMSLCLSLVGCGACAQHDHANHVSEKPMSQAVEPMFKDNDLGTAYHHYIHLKEALVASEVGEAQKAAVELEKSLASVENAKNAKNEAFKVTSAASLEDQRSHFAGLSNEMAELVKKGALAMGKIFLEYCPMANSNTGGYWLSNEKEIKNPYFGDKMLKCGSIKETID